MKKIGILTYHNNNNRGAILQAYCLWKSLKRELNNTIVEIIDYRTLSKEFKRIYTFNPKKFIRKILDFNTSVNFFKEQNAMSSNNIITNDYEKAINFLKKEKYDMIVVGSDVVWRVTKEKNFSPTCRSFPNAYFLHPNLNTIKVSYAASASITDLESLSKKRVNKIRKYLSAFEKISVRDRHTFNLLQKLGISNIVQVPDPTILIDIPEVDGEKLLESYGISPNKPILGIFRLGKLESKITEYFHKKDYQIVSLSPSKNADLDLTGELNPIEYYSIYKYFDMGISNSLHSTIFSLKHRIPFATLDYSSGKFEKKTESLLRDFSLLDRHIKISNQTPDDIMNKIKTCEEELDKDQVRKRMTSIRQNGLKYIKELEELLDEKKI